MEQSAKGLRILLADEDEATLRATDKILEALGHTVTGHATNVGRAGELIAREDPDISIVVVDEDDEHALDLIDEMTTYARGPIVALVGGHEPGFVSSAAERGIYAFARMRFIDEVEGAIELAMRRHTETARLTEQVSQLESALERRGAIERAKGILMERHGVDERAAFELLRQHSRKSSRRVIDLAKAVADGHALLPGADDRA
ncbi:MAG: two-component system, response regulator PdtaR [bacterium]|jgi:response regulator NasT